jgi:hypothetical protein
MTGNVDGEVYRDADGSRCLSISSKGSFKYKQMWWMTQPLPCSGGATYTVTVSVKGLLDNQDTLHSIGIFFQDDKGKWLGFQPINKNPNGSITHDWQKLEGSIVAPDGASKMELRVGVVFMDSDSKTLFKDLSVRQTGA